MWTQSYDDLLLEWAALREQASSLPLEEALTLIHDWWNTAPIVNNTVHFNDEKNWPLPWDLLAQPAYCDVAKCLGIVYTLILSDIIDTVDTVFLLQTNEHCVVSINGGQYILNEQPDEIIGDLSSLDVLYSVNCEGLVQKLGK